MIGNARVLIVALNTYTSSYNDGKLAFVGDRVSKLTVATADVSTLWGRASDRKAEEYDVLVLPTRMGARPVSTMLPGLRELAERVEPDLIHVECEPWQAIALQSVLLAHRRSIPVGIQFAENGPQLAGRAGAVRRHVARRALRHCDYAVGWSTGSSDVAKALAPGLRIETFPGSGIGAMPEPSTVADPRRWYGDGSDALPKLAFVGRFSPEKGVLDFMALCDELAARWPMRAALVGGGGQDQDVQRWAATRPWAHMHGVIPRPEALEVIASGDVLICPSRTLRHVKEQFGKAPVEAMAAGTPVVAYDCGALAEVIGSGGVVVPEGDRGSLAQAVDGQLNAPRGAREARSTAARSRAACFTDEAIADRLVDLWASVL